MVKTLGASLLVLAALAGAARAQTNTGFIRAADYSADHGGRAMLVQREGKILFERYDRGWSATTPHPLASGTKSFTGVMAMMAVQDGLLTLDEKACDTLVEWKNDPRKSGITPRHLLTLSSGLKPGDKELGGPSGSNMLGFAASARAKRLGLGQTTSRPTNTFLTAVNLPTSHDPGSRFEYGPSHFYAFGELLQRKLARSGGEQKTTMDYLRHRILEPMGLKSARIGFDRAGNPNLPGGMLLTAREWARFGQVVADDGSLRKPDGGLTPWLKPELLEQCFLASGPNPNYGLTWWLPGSSWGSPATADSGGAFPRARLRQARPAELKGPDGKRLKVYMAAGLGKQRLYVIPAYGLVVVRFAEGTQQGLQFNDQRFLQPILENVRALR